MGLIKTIQAREIMDSRGVPTVEVEVGLEDGSRGRFSVPSGASTGRHEAVELRDGDLKRYHGKGVLRAIANVNQFIAPALTGKDSAEQRKIDELMIALDGTPNKARLGANAVLGVSVAVAKAHASFRGVDFYESLLDNRAPSLPLPLMNIINGGAHADNGLDIQEFMLVPHGAPSFKEALRYGAEIFYCLKSLFKSKGLSTAVGDEGGFAPSLNSNEQAIDWMLMAIEKAGFKPGKEVALALDVAATEWYDDEKHAYVSKELGTLNSQNLVELWEKWCNSYPIVSIEDGLSEDDFDGWFLMTQKLGKKIQLVGDDLFVTNTARLREGREKGFGNAILIKLNQIGTLTETLDVIEMAKESHYNTIISHRSGETEDPTIADVAVGCAAGQIKTGSLSRSERLAKYNQLLRIEEKLGKEAVFAGQIVLAGDR